MLSDYWKMACWWHSSDLLVGVKWCVRIDVFPRQTPWQEVIRVNNGVPSETNYILFHAVLHISSLDFAWYRLFFLYTPSFLASVSPHWFPDDQLLWNQKWGRLGQSNQSYEHRSRAGFSVLPNRCALSNGIPVSSWKLLCARWGRKPGLTAHT